MNIAVIPKPAELQKPVPQLLPNAVKPAPAKQPMQKQVKPFAQAMKAAQANSPAKAKTVPRKPKAAEQSEDDDREMENEPETDEETDEMSQMGNFRANNLLFIMSDSFKGPQPVKKSGNASKRDQAPSALVLSQLAQMLNISEKLVTEMLNTLRMDAGELEDPAKMEIFLTELSSEPSFTAAQAQGLPGVASVSADFKTLDNSELITKPIPIDAGGESRVLRAEATDLEYLARIMSAKVESITHAQAENGQAQPELTDNIQPEGVQPVPEDEKPSALFDKPQARLNELAMPNQPPEDMSVAVPQQDMQPAETFERVADAVLEPPELKPAEIIDQVVNQVRSDPTNSVSELRVTLKPESLGDVTLRLLSENGQISARFIAENQRVKEIMESNFDALRDALNRQGLNVSQLSVSVEQRQNAESRYGQGQQRHTVRHGIITSVEAAEEHETPESSAAHFTSRVSYTA
jgi:flagellar hook-length control protein FliK